MPGVGAAELGAQEAAAFIVEVGRAAAPLPSAGPERAHTPWRAGGDATTGEQRGARRGGGGDVLGELRRSMCQVGWRGQQNSCLAAATAVLIQTATPFLLLARCL